MRILVTGGSGYIGSVLARKLCDRGHHVRIVDTFQFGAAGTLDLPEASRNDCFAGNILEPNPAWFRDIDAVAHLAGFSNDPMADADPALNHEVNVTGTRRVVEAAIAAGITRLTFGSSASIYDRGESGFQPYATEVDAVAPIGAYSESKHLAERIILELAQQNPGFRPVIFRQATVFGQSPRMRYDLVVNTMTRAAVKDGFVEVHVDPPGPTLRPLIHVEALCELHVRALEDRRLGPGIFNAVGGNYSIDAVGVVVASACGAYVKHVKVPEGRRVRNYRCSLAKQSVAFGPTASFGTLEKAVREMAAAMPEDPFDARFENIAAMKKSGVLA